MFKNSPTANSPSSPSGSCKNCGSPVFVAFNGGVYHHPSGVTYCQFVPGQSELYKNLYAEMEKPATKVYEIEKTIKPYEKVCKHCGVVIVPTLSGGYPIERHIERQWIHKDPTWYSCAFASPVKHSNLFTDAESADGTQFCKHCGLPVKYITDLAIPRWKHVTNDAVGGLDGWDGCIYAVKNNNTGIKPLQELGLGLENKYATPGWKAKQPVTQPVKQTVTQPTKQSVVNVPVLNPEPTGPLCRYCKEPIQQRNGGVYHGHWEHVEFQYQYAPSSDGYFYKVRHSNKWSCCVPHTSDKKFHVADNTKDPNAKKLVYDTKSAPPPIYIAPPQSAVATQPVNVLPTTQETSGVSHGSTESTHTIYVVETYTRRKFKKG